MQELINKYGKEWYCENQSRALLYRNFEVYTDTFEYVHVGYDGAPDAHDYRFDDATSLTEALYEIDGMYLDHDLDCDGNFKEV